MLLLQTTHCPGHRRCVWGGAAWQMGGGGICVGPEVGAGNGPFALHAEPGRQAPRALCARMCHPLEPRLRVVPQLDEAVAQRERRGLRAQVRGAEGVCVWGAVIGTRHKQEGKRRRRRAGQREAQPRGDVVGWVGVCEG